MSALFRTALLTLFVTFVMGSEKGVAQCFQIESILVDACGPQEGLNEMVRFRIGPTAVNTSNLSVTWPNNPWQGLLQNATTAAITAQLNGDIIDAGGCGQLIEPTAGVLPANASVVLVTSYNLDTNANQFGPITSDIYILYQNNPSTIGGHFANSGTGLRTLQIAFGACSDTVTYDRAQLINQTGGTSSTNADGSTVEFNAAGNPTYINNGCAAPVPPFTVNAGSPVSGCPGAVVSLAGSAENYQSVTWSAATGTFSNSGSLSTQFTIPANVTGTLVITLTATNSCGAEVSDTVNVTVTAAQTPNFTSPLSLCSGAAPPTLATTSPNGITGTWSPATINTSASGSYVFTPTTGQCASPFTLQVNVTPATTPNFASPLTVCQGATPPALATTSPNGITGTWSPATINTSASGSYVFTPTTGQCASPFTLQVNVTPATTPNFASPLTVCQGATPPTLATTSPNGVTGTWSPATINTSASGSYVFTPTTGQCASPFTLQVNVTPATTPNFASPLTVCQGATPPALATTSPNGITGTWSPATINTSASGSYVFTPTTGQCASPFTLQVNVTPATTPNFASPLTVCQGATPPALATTSPNGVTGTWSPSTINTSASGSYVFTPNTGQCASPFTLQVNVTPATTPNFASPLTVCQGATPPALATTSPNGITGTWSPATINTSASGSYVFTPTTGQCASPFTLQVNVTPATTPNFASPLTVCQGATPPALATTSPNGVTGTWSPATINTSASGSYVFTPTTGQCASPFTLQVNVTSTTTPNFASPLTVCQGATPPALATTSPNGVTGTWSPATINTSASGSYVFTPNTGQCASSFTLEVTVTPTIVPNFPSPIAVCQGSTPPALATTSPNGVTGTWSPSTIDTTTNGSYLFTPNAGQCATPFTLQVNVGTLIAPDFPTTLALCGGDPVPVLAATSPNGVTGTWSPAVVNATTTANYVFTPNAGQCAVPHTLLVEVTTPVVPDFPTTLSFCQGAVAPSLETTSPNGITGTWSPATIDTSLSGNYLFTPTAGQCALPLTLAVTINPLLAPDFTTPLTVCQGGTAPILAGTSPNGITGTWSPAAISTSANGSYVFTPTTGQCASPFTLFVQVAPIVTPDFATTLSICQGDTVPALSTTSPNGISGSWVPSVIDNNANGSYVFTPNTGECATPVTLQVTVTPVITPNFATPIVLCQGGVAPVLPTTSPNGVTGSWSPAIINTAVSGNYVFTPAIGQCAAPFTLQVEVQTATVPSFSSPLTLCAGTVPPALATTSPNGITGSWSPSVIDPVTDADYVFTPDPGQCATPFTLQVTINATVAPEFTSPISLCQGSPAPTLAATSPNGITGTWAPSTVDTTAGGTYIFTPNSGQCATAFTLQVNVTPPVTPDFPTSIAFCEGATPPVLSASSPNGVTGVWTPAVIDNQVSATYVFAPDAGQCASAVSVQVTVTPPVEPDFDAELTLCNGQTPPVLAPVSPNGISGTWTPSVIDGTQSATYTFVPDAGQCAVPTTLDVTIGAISVTVVEGCDGLQYLLSAQLPTGVDPDTVDYTWRNGTSIVGTDPTLNVTETAASGGLTFPVTFEVTVTTPDGCSNSQSYPVAGISCGIPRGISPNGDSKNDVFDLTGFGVAHITIFNRYGVEVYSRTNYTNQWDGRTNDGQELPSATYYYVIDRTDGKNFSGWVYINR